MRQPARVIEIPSAPPARQPISGEVGPPIMDEQGTPAFFDPIRDKRHGDPIDIPRETIAALIPPRPKQPGVEVKCDPANRELIVFFNSNIICVLKWLPSIQRFLIKRCQELLPKNPRSATWLQHQGTLHDCWRVAGELGVTVEEFQESFVEMPPEIPWTGKDCPENRTDCQLTYAGDPRSTAMPDLACRTCNARFKMLQDGRLQLMDAGTGGGEADTAGTISATPRPSRPEVPFGRDLVRYQGMGKAKLEKLEEHGIRSWEDILRLGNEALAAIPGFSGRTADFLIEIAKEKTL